MGRSEAAAAQWEPYKAELERLFLTENKDLKDVVKIMKQEHSFAKSERQYSRQFEKWGFWKKISKAECEYMAHQRRKRKQENKNTEFEKLGRRITSAQLHRALRRHLSEGSQAISLTGGYPPDVSIMSNWNVVKLMNAAEHGPPAPGGIRLLTPPPVSADFRIEVDGLPFSQFLRSLRQVGVFRGLSLSPRLDPMTFLTDAIISKPAAPWAKSKYNPFGFLEALEIGEATEMLHRPAGAIIHRSLADALFYTISYCVYLSSNNLLPNDTLDKIIQWVVVNEQGLPLFDILKHDSPTMVIFMRQMLRYATRLGHTRLVHYLLQVCLSFDNPRRILRDYVLLSMAIQYNQVELATHILDAGTPLKHPGMNLLTILQWGNYEILEILLSKGLCRHDTGVEGDVGTLLETAVHFGNMTIVKLLLESGANRNISDTIFFRALVKHGAVAELLVRFGLNASVEFDLNYDQISGYMSEELIFFYPVQTPLQIAAQCGNWDLVRCLVELGAKVDPPYFRAIEKRCNKWVARIHDRFDTSAIIPVASALQAAVRHGNIEMTLFLLQNGANVDERPGLGHGYTALQVAVATGNRELVNLLLEWKADINVPAGCCIGSTALQLAAGLQDTSIFYVLLHRGAKVKAKSGSSVKTVLQAAAYAGNIILVQFLLDNGYTDVTEPPAPNSGRTALQVASESPSSSSLDIVKILLSKGADSNEPPAMKDGITALQAAASGGSIAKARLLLDAGAQIEMCSEQYGCTALHKAIENRHYDMVGFLLRHGATPYYGACSATKRTPLQEACWNGDTQTASLLLDYDPPRISVNMPASFEGGVTALQAAVKSRNLQLIQLLLESGADPNAPGAVSGGKAALERAILAFDFRIAQLLLKSGARFEADCKPLRDAIWDYWCSGNEQERNAWRRMLSGLIPLMMTSGLYIKIFPLYMIKSVMNFAISARRLDLVGFLLSSRLFPINLAITPHIAGTDFTGLQLAASIGSVESVKLFVKHGVDVNEPGIKPDQEAALRIAAREGHVEVVRYLLEHETYNTVSANCDRALQNAARHGHTEIVKLLVEHGGADVNAPACGDYGRTALQAAAECGSVDTVKYLLEQKVDVNAAPSTHGGVTALQAAAIKGQAQVFLILLNSDADVTAPGATEFGRTAIEGAAEHGRQDILHMLLQIHPPDQNLADQLETAEQLAEMNENPEVVVVIQDYRESRGWSNLSSQ